MGGSRSAAPMAMSPSLTKGDVASNACSGPFLLLSSWCGAAVMRWFEIFSAIPGMT